MSEFSASSSTESPDDIQFKWKQLGDLALMCGEMELSKDCAEKANDLSGLLLMYTSYGDRASIEQLIVKARNIGKFNIAFVSSFILGDVHQCMDMLLEIGRVPEAALFARTYVPSRIGEVVQRWKTELSKISDVLAQSLADPSDHPEGFPNLSLALQAEEIYKNAYSKRGPNSSNYVMYCDERNRLMNDAGEIDVLALLSNGDSLVSGPGFGGSATAASPTIGATVKQEVQAKVQAEVQAEVQEEEVAEENDDDDDDDDDLLADDDEDNEGLNDTEDEEENAEPEEAVAAPAAAPAAPVAAPVSAPEAPAPEEEDVDDEDLDDLLDMSDDDDDMVGADASKDDDDIDLDDLDLDDDDEWS